MSKKQGATSETKLQAVLSLLRKEEPATNIARRYCVSEESLYRWREEFLSAGKNALNGARTPKVEQETRRLQKEISDRDQVIGELTIANRILKKFRTAYSDLRAS